jgi:hypothetical protein
MMRNGKNRTKNGSLIANSTKRSAIRMKNFASRSTGLVSRRAINDHSAMKTYLVTRAACAGPVRGSKASSVEVYAPLYLVSTVSWSKTICDGVPGNGGVVVSKTLDCNCAACIGLGPRLPWPAIHGMLQTPS